MLHPSRRRTPLVERRSRLQAGQATLACRSVLRRRRAASAPCSMRSAGSRGAPRAVATAPAAHPPIDGGWRLRSDRGHAEAQWRVRAAERTLLSASRSAAAASASCELSARLCTCWRCTSISISCNRPYVKAGRESRPCTHVLGGTTRADACITAGSEAWLSSSEEVHPATAHTGAFSAAAIRTTAACNP